MSYIFFVAGMWFGVCAALVAHDLFHELCIWRSRRRDATDLTDKLARAWVAQDRRVN